ncbi:MAG: glutamate racemase [Maricaulaceae bacterium]
MARALVFDSGVGGLSVTEAIREHLPNLKLDYAADDAFRPYGNKSAEALGARLPGLLWSLSDMLGSDCIVLACNTASTTALPVIRAALDIPVIGVVPAIKPAAKASQSGHIGVLGTPGTVARDYVDRLIQDHAQQCRVTLKGSVELVGMAEAKLTGQAIDMAALKEELNVFTQQTPPVDQIVLACTHFPLLHDELSTCLGAGVTWVDSGEAIARRVDSVLRGLNLSTVDETARQYAFTTGDGIGAARQAVFKDYGFSRLISLA